jgi:hypothetical protein
MKISPDVKDSILFIGGCIGMATFGLVMPVLGLGFNPALFGAWSAVAGAGFFAGMDSRRKNGDPK